MRPTDAVKTHYHRQELLADEGGVKTHSGRDPLNGLPVRIYDFSGEPTAPAGRLSTFIPVLLASSHRSDGPAGSGAGQGEVVSAFSASYRPVQAPVSAGNARTLLRQSATALDDAARAGVIHGDLRPERVFFVDEAERPDVPPRRRYLLEGYGVPWPLRASEYSAPERIAGASYAGDIFSWALTMRTLTGPLPGEVRDLLLSCLDADPERRPHARDLCAALARCSWHDPAPHVQVLEPGEARAEASSGATGAAEAPERRAPLSPPGTAFAEFRSTSEAEVDDVDAADARLRDAFFPPPVRLLQDAPPGKTALEVPARETTAREASAEGGQEGTEDAAAEADSLEEPARVRAQAAPQPTPPAAAGDALKRTDATEAYRERRARYEAEHGAEGGAQSRAASPAEAASAGAKADHTQPDHPRPDYPKSDSAPQSRSRRLDPDDDFEVVDDIDERAPDPTAPRGGLRVVLLSLLVIATLVLLALLLFNP